MQEVVDATLLKKVTTSIERNKSLQMLYIGIGHDGVVEAVLKGAGVNSTLKKLTTRLRLFQECPKAATVDAIAKLRQAQPQLEFQSYYYY